MITYAFFALVQIISINKTKLHFLYNNYKIQNMIVFIFIFLNEEYKLLLIKCQYIFYYLINKINFFFHILNNFKIIT